MKKLVIFLILLTSLLFTSGCIENAQENSTNHQNILNKGVVVEASQLKQINISLQKGPVLLEIGEKECDYCQAIKPILGQIAVEYGSTVTVMSVDMDNSPKIANYFGAYVVPVSFVILDIKNGNYIYMREDGNVSTDKFNAKIIGPRDKDVLEKILDTAIQQEKDKSK